MEISIYYWIQFSMEDNVELYEQCKYVAVVIWPLTKIYRLLCFCALKKKKKKKLPTSMWIFQPFHLAYAVTIVNSTDHNTNLIGFSAMWSSTVFRFIPLGKLIQRQTISSWPIVDIFVYPLQQSTFHHLPQ